MERQINSPFNERRTPATDVAYPYLLFRNRHDWNKEKLKPSCLFRGDQGAYCQLTEQIHCYARAIVPTIVAMRA